MNKQRYDELLENGTITQEEYDVLTAEPQPQPEPDPQPEPAKPVTGSWFEDYIHNLNGDDLQ